MPQEFILYQTEDGLTRVQLRAHDGSVWLTQVDMAELFAITKQNVSLHVANVLKEGELAADSVVKDSLTTAAEGKNYLTKLYRPEMILTLGYRVRRDFERVAQAITTLALLKRRSDRALSFINLIASSALSIGAGAQFDYEH